MLPLSDISPISLGLSLKHDQTTPHKFRIVELGDRRLGRRLSFHLQKANASMMARVNISGQQHG
jgi:hypothetical protein